MKQIVYIIIIIECSLRKTIEYSRNNANFSSKLIHALLSFIIEYKTTNCNKAYNTNSYFVQLK